MIKMIWKSFYDTNAYRNALENWRWKFLCYFLMVCAVFTLLTSIPIINRAKTQFFNAEEFILKQIPNGKIKDGRFTMENADRVFVTLPEGRPVIAFTNNLLESADTNGLLLSVEKDRVSFYNIFSAESFFFYSDFEEKFSEYVKEKFGMDTSEGIPVNAELFKKIIPLVKLGMIISLPVFIFASATTMLAIMALSLSLPIFIMSLRRMPLLGYFGALKISLIAATPAMIFFAVEIMANYNFSGGFIYMFLCFAIAWRVIKRLAAAN